MEKIRRIFLSSICFLISLSVAACNNKFVVNNVFVYLVHEDCISMGKIGIIVDGKPTWYSESTYQWQSVFVGERSQEVAAMPNAGYQFIKWSDGNTNISRSDLASNDNFSGPVVYYALFEVINE